MTLIAKPFSRYKALHANLTGQKPTAKTYQTIAQLYKHLHVAKSEQKVEQVSTELNTEAAVSNTGALQIDMLDYYDFLGICR